MKITDLNTDLQYHHLEQQRVYAQVADTGVWSVDSTVVIIDPDDVPPAGYAELGTVEDLTDWLGSFDDDHQRFVEYMNDLMSNQG